ncbi:DMT family transporter [Catenulispora yoronensis]|uniref:DMT family transporter n=1 Tax=Catenulispora yoronensis TaxID=450799 RepID=A0ABP5H5X5_9ACTN
MTLRNVSAVLGAALIWSTSFAVTKVTLARVPPMTIGAMRFGIAALILAALVHVRRGRSRSERVRSLPTVRQRLSIGLAGLLGISAYFAVENLGVQKATASDATLIVASYPIITLAVELVLRRTGLSLVRLAGMVIALGGVWLIVRDGAGADAESRLWGDALLILGGLVWAGFNLLGRRDTSGASPIVVTYYQTLAGALGLTALSLTETDRWAWPSNADLGRILFLAALCSVAAFGLYNYGLRGLTPSAAVNLLNIVPVAGLVWAATLAGESIGARLVVGGAVVIAGVVIGQYGGSAATVHRARTGAGTGTGSGSGTGTETGTEPADNQAPHSMVATESPMPQRTASS